MYLYTNIPTSFQSMWNHDISVAGRSADNAEVPGSNNRDGYTICLFFKKDSFRKFPQLSKRTCDYFSKMSKVKWFCDMYIRGDRSRDYRTFCRTHYLLTHGCRIQMIPELQVLRIYSRFHRAILQQWKWMQLNEHWTTRVHKALPAKVIHENLK